MDILFQAVWPLLEQSKQPKFVYISSPGASITTPIPLPTGAYGASNKAGNFIMAKIHQEHPGPSLTTFSLHPGSPLTDMGHASIEGLVHLFPTIEDYFIPIDQAVAGVLNRVDAATHENSGGRFNILKRGTLRGKQTSL